MKTATERESTIQKVKESPQGKSNIYKSDSKQEGGNKGSWGGVSSEWSSRKIWEVWYPVVREDFQ